MARKSSLVDRGRVLQKRRKPSIGALIVLYNRANYITYCLDAIYEHVDKIVICASKLPWAYNPDARHDYRADDSIALARDFPDPDDKIIVLDGAWDKEEDQRNAGLGQLREQGMGYCFIVDPEDIWKESHLKTLTELIVAYPWADTFFARFHSFWKQINFKVTGRDQYYPVVHKIKKGSAFTRNRQIGNSQYKFCIPPELASVYRFSFVLSDDQIQNKIATWQDHDRVMSYWYKAKWLAYRAGETLNLHPTSPQSWPSTELFNVKLLPSVLFRHPEYNAALQHQQEQVDSVSLCIVVRNEEKMLKRCLASFQPLVDEVIIVDTGSTDNTVQVAMECGVQAKQSVHFQPGASPDHFDFSVARNESLSHATKDWILWVDADDVTCEDDAHYLFRFLKRKDFATHNVLLVPYRSGSAISMRVRLFRNHLGLQFKGIVHEEVSLESSNETNPVIVNGLSVGIEHKPRVDRESHSDLYHEISRNALEENPRDSLLLLHEGIYFLSQNRPEEARARLERALTCPDCQGEMRLQCELTLATALLLSGNLEGSEALLKPLVDRWPDNCVTRVVLCDTLRSANKFKEALEIIDPVAYQSPREFMPTQRTKEFHENSIAWLKEQCWIGLQGSADTVLPVDIVIVCGSDLDATKRCMESVVSNTAHPIRLILMDGNANGHVHTSLHSTADAIVIERETAGGFVGAVAGALKECSGDFMLVLNDRCEIPKNDPYWLHRMISHALDEKVAAVGPVLGSVTSKQSAESHYSMQVDMKHGRVIASPKAPLHVETTMLSQRCVLFRSDVIKGQSALEAVEEKSTFYLTFGLRAEGYKLIIARDVFVDDEGQWKEWCNLLGGSQNLDRVAFGKTVSSTNEMETPRLPEAPILWPRSLHVPQPSESQA